jgi:hypothetical protein
MVLAISFHAVDTSALHLEVIRQHYLVAVMDKSICYSMVLELEKDVESNVHLAYLGAFQAIWAQHTFNPFEKLSSFHKGIKNIEKAATQSPNNIEVIFIRYSVQKNCPRFLGYSDHLREDEMFLQANRKNITSPTLKSMVENLLKN